LEAEAKRLRKEKIFHQETQPPSKRNCSLNPLSHFESQEDEKIKNDESLKRILIVLIIIKRS